MSAKKNQLIIDLGKVRITEDQLRNLNLAIHGTVAKQIKSVEKENATKDMSGVAAAFNASPGGSAPLMKTANIVATFTKVVIGRTKMTATFNGQEKEITQSGTITFDGVSKNDFISIDGTSLGNATITIDIDARPTLMNFTPGNFDDNFIIK